MGNRSKYVAWGSAAVGVAAVARRRRRRGRLGEAAEGFVDTVMPSIGRDAPAKTPPEGIDEAHAPGHRHLPWRAKAVEEPVTEGEVSRPFAKHHRGLRHPGRGGG
jgi:hypothetical protein